MRRVNGSALLPDLPNWVPLEAWEAWLEVRKLRKIPNTERALRIALAKLDRLRAAGQNVEAVIDQSVERGWTTFYPYRETAEAPKVAAPAAPRKPEPPEPQVPGVPMPDDVRAKLKTLIRRMH